MSIHTFEVPLYSEPSPHFKKFLRDLGTPINNDCFAMYWRGKLTFRSHFLDDNGRKASVVPISSIFSMKKLDYVEQNVSLFASKFNMANSLREKGVDINIELIYDISAKDMCKYDGNIEAIIRVTAVCTNLAAELALNNFFTVIDPHSDE